MKTLAVRRSPLPARRRSRGLAAVEMVLVVPILLLLGLAVVELGRAYWQYERLTVAVRNGARHLAGHAIYGSSGVVDFSRIPQVLTESRNLVVYGSTAAGGETLLPGLVPADVTLADLGGGDVAVTCNYEYRPLLAAVIPVFPPIVQGGSSGPLHLDLTATVSMRAL